MDKLPPLSANIPGLPIQNTAYLAPNVGKKDTRLIFNSSVIIFLFLLISQRINALSNGYKQNLLDSKKEQSKTNANIEILNGNIFITCQSRKIIA